MRGCRAARRLLVKGGAALEALARVGVVVLDKTGTLTEGEAALSGDHAVGILSADEVLRLAASLDQASSHVVAGAIVAAARERGLHLSLPTDSVESAGTGIEGTADGRRVSRLRRRFVQRRSVIDVAEAAAWPSGPGSHWRWLPSMGGSPAPWLSPTASGRRRRRCSAPFAVSAFAGWCSPRATTPPLPERWPASSASTTCVATLLRGAVIRARSVATPC